MKSKMVRVGLYLSSAVSVFGIVSQAHAAELTEASTTAALLAILTTVSTIAGAVILAGLTFMALLMGAGWGYRFFKRHLGKRI